MTAWTQLLDDYASLLDRAEAALDAGVFPGDGWQGDELMHPGVEPTPMEIKRYASLATRADLVEGRLENARLAVLEELGDVRRRRQAARGYAQNLGRHDNTPDAA